MERYKQIMNASHNYSTTIQRDGFDYEDMKAAFEEGAMWADEYPNKKLVYTKKELLDMGFGFDPNGNINTPQEIEKGAKKYINYQKAKWIEKACSWLREQKELIGVSFQEDFIERFKIAMKTDHENSSELVNKHSVNVWHDVSEEPKDNSLQIVNPIFSLFQA